MLLREAQIPMYYDQEAKYKEEDKYLSISHQSFTTRDLLNWKHHIPFFKEEPQARIDLMQSIIQNHKPIWTDCRLLLLTPFNTEVWCNIMLAALKWLEDHTPEGTLNTQVYAHAYFPEENPHWDHNNR
jgi:hypothetical protein